MTRSINYPESFYRIIPFLIWIFMTCAGFLAGCSKSPTTCDAKKVKKAVIAEYIDILKGRVSSVAGASGQPGMELSEDEWRMMRAGMNFELKNIKQFRFDKAKGQLECEADLIMYSSGTQKDIPIEYTADVTEGTDQVLVTIYELE
jgi:hypothetical protein